MDEQGNKRTRIRVEEFGTAIRLGETAGSGGGDVGMGEGRYLEADEVECLLANMIYKVNTISPSDFLPYPNARNSGDTNTFLEPDEGLHLPRPRHGRAV